MLIANTIKRIVNSYTTNVRITMTDHQFDAAQKELMTFLREIELRAALLPIDHPNRIKFDTMRLSMKRPLEIAVADWELFCETYQCKICYNAEIKTSECFYIYIKEKCAFSAGSDWEMRFNNLMKIQTH